MVDLHEIWEDASYIFIVMVRCRCFYCVCYISERGCATHWRCWLARIQRWGRAPAASAGMQAGGWGTAVSDWACFHSQLLQEACMGGELFDMVIERKHFTEVGIQVGIQVGILQQPRGWRGSSSRGQGEALGTAHGMEVSHVQVAQSCALRWAAAAHAQFAALAMLPACRRTLPPSPLQF